VTRRYGAPMRTIDVDLPIDLRSSLAPLVASRRDPTIRLRPDGFIRTFRTVDGPVTLEVRAVSDRRFEAAAIGPGSEHTLEHVGGLLGASDELSGFTPDRDPTVARAHRRRPGLRIIRTGNVEDLLVATILAQRVTSREAGSAWTRMVTDWGSPGPGDTGLRLPPTFGQLAERPSYDFARIGVEKSRAQRIVDACRHLGDPSHPLRSDAGGVMAEQLARLPGIGPWTAAIVARTAVGDPDTVEVGDYHVKHHVTYALTGEARGSDERMLELLVPFAGHRGRVIRLLRSVVPRPPAFGPRQRIVPIDVR
jgi:3-methyladenine DNA glycosylase/8-oxoguanine DNA glycosylase